MHPNQNKPLWVIGHRLTSVTTTGDYALADIQLTPSLPGPPPHHHAEADELYYVLEGRVEFLRGEQWHAVEAGNRFHVSKGTIHSFRSVNGGAARFLSIHDPGAAMDALFLDYGIPVEEPDSFNRSISEATIERFTAAAADHDMIIQTPEPA
jgi:mannose-6-phosphate isomerase-like protein (cupin superfamily)